MIKLVALIIIIVLLAGAGVFFFPQLINKVNLFKPSASTYFDSQTATLSGKITKIDGDTMTIENSRGESKTFKASPSLTVFDPMFTQNPGTQPGTDAPVIEQKKPEAGKQVTVTFQIIDGDHQIIGLSYLPEAITSSARPAATPDAAYERERAKFNPPPLNSTRPATPSASTR